MRGFVRTYALLTLPVKRWCAQCAATEAWEGTGCSLAGTATQACVGSLAWLLANGHRLMAKGLPVRQTAVIVVPMHGSADAMYAMYARSPDTLEPWPIKKDTRWLCIDARYHAWQR